MLLPFPADFPTDAIPVLIGYLRKTKTVGESANAAWNVLGYGGGKVFSGPLLLTTPDHEGTDEEMAKELEGAFASIPEGAQPIMGGVLSPLIQALLARVVKRLLDQWLQPA